MPAAGLLSISVSLRTASRRLDQGIDRVGIDSMIPSMPRLAASCMYELIRASSVGVPLDYFSGRAMRAHTHTHIQPNIGNIMLPCATERLK